MAELYNVTYIKNLVKIPTDVELGRETHVMNQLSNARPCVS
jgi:hypothetical protein